MQIKTLQVSKRYARALFSLSQEEGIVSTTYEDMQLVDKVFSGNKDLRILMSSPVIREGKKQKILRALFEKYIHPLNMGYMLIVVRKQRAGLLSGIAKAYIHVYKEAMGIVPVCVITAAEMDESLQARVLEISRKLTDLEIEFTKKVDPSIIGGFILQIGDMQYDASLRNRLSVMRRQLNI